MIPFEGLDDYSDLMKHIDRTELEQAQALARALSKWCTQSVIDVGCGSGLYLIELQKQGWTIYGIDAEKTAGAQLAEGQFERVDLRFPYTPRLKYVLALCIEVAEHLEEAYADTLIATLCNCAEIIVFSAASPGQPGICHYNCQPKEYWLDKFAKHGYKLNSRATERRVELLKLYGGCADWLLNNLMVIENRSFEDE